MSDNWELGIVKNMLARESTKMLDAIEKGQEPDDQTMDRVIKLLTLKRHYEPKEIKASGKWGE